MGRRPARQRACRPAAAVASKAATPAVAAASSSANVRMPLSSEWPTVSRRSAAHVAYACRRRARCPRRASARRCPWSSAPGSASSGQLVALDQELLDEHAARRALDLDAASAPGGTAARRLASAPSTSAAPARSRRRTVRRRRDPSSAPAEAASESILDRLALGVAGRRRRAERRRDAIGLARFEHVGRKPRGGAEEDRQHARCERV